MFIEHHTRVRHGQADFPIDAPPPPPSVMTDARECCRTGVQWKSEKLKTRLLYLPPPIPHGTARAWSISRERLHHGRVSEGSRPTYPRRTVSPLRRSRRPRRTSPEHVARAATKTREERTPLSLSRVRHTRCTLFVYRQRRGRVRRVCRRLRFVHRLLMETRRSIITARGIDAHAYCTRVDDAMMRARDRIMVAGQ